MARTFQIAKAATSTTVTSAPNPAGPGQPVTVTASVTSPAGTPAGTVAFKDGGDLIAGCENRALSSGQAVCATSSLGAGTHAVTAEYSGDANFLASTGSLSGGQAVGGIFEFSQAVYAVAERGGQVAVTVRRVGDASQAAGVDYETEDGSTPSVAVPCSATTGLALERCDYTRAAGALNFAAGETEKTFTVLVSDDSYTEGDETLRLVLSGPSVGATLGPQATAALQITDDSPESSINLIDDDEAFVRQHYHDFLNREPDAAGLKFWTDGLKACGADQQCREVRRVNTSAAFFLSIEFQETGFLVYRMHKAAFGDSAGLPVPVRLNQFLFDGRAIQKGVVVGQDGWQQQLEANKAAFALSFVRRPEFLAHFPAPTGPTAFVNLLDANAGGVLSPAEKAALVNELSPNPSDASLRANVLRKVAENAAFAQAESNRAFVLTQYFGYLRRDPDAAPNTNFDGYLFWLTKLDQFHGDFVRAEMVKAFISSIEYRQRFGQ